MRTNVKELLAKEIKSIDITSRGGIDYHLYVEKRDDGTYFLKNNETEIPNEFHQYHDDLPAFAFQKAVEEYHKVLKDGEEDRCSYFKGTTLFTVRFKDGTMKWHSFYNTKEHLAFCKAMMTYNDFLRGNSIAWDPRTIRYFQIKYANIDIEEVRKAFRDGYIWLSQIFPNVISKVFDDMDCWYDCFTRVDEDRSLHIYHCMYNGRVHNEIYVDAEGNIIKTAGISLLELFKQGNIRLRHEYEPGWIGDQGMAINEYTLNSLKKYLEEQQ